MIDLIGLQRPNDADLVSDRANFRQDRTDHLTGLTKLLKLMGRAETLQIVCLTLKLRDLLALGIGLWQWRAGHLCKRRLGVKGLQV